MHGGAELHHWRWRGGLLTDYLYAPPPAAAADAADSRPAIVLVHGFGAFSEHWRDNVAALAAAGYHVYAPTLPGYGFSEKPVLPYGQVSGVVRRGIVGGVFKGFRELEHACLMPLHAVIVVAAAPTNPLSPLAFPRLQDAWSAFVADFVLQVVRRPVVLAGSEAPNSSSAPAAASIISHCAQQRAAV